MSPRFQVSPRLEKDLSSPLRHSCTAAPSVGGGFVAHDELYAPPRWFVNCVFLLRPAWSARAKVDLPLLELLSAWGVSDSVIDVSAISSIEVFRS